MYLHLFPNTIESTANTETHTIKEQHSLNSTNVPLARPYGPAFNETESRKSLTAPLKLDHYQWQPVSFGDGVVYVRRAYAC